MSTTTQGLTSDVIPPPPFSKDELREQWNAQADVDEFNHWDNLGLDEQLAWAQTRAIAADRAQGGPCDQPPPVAAADRPRYLQQTIDGWKAADHRDGPWRPFSAPQAVPPFPVVKAPAVEAGSTPAAAEPLWRVMVRAYNNAPELPDGIEDRQMYAAEIVAARNWLKRRLPEGGAWYVLLTTEADRAKRGE